MDEKEFAAVLVNELVDNIPVDSRLFLSENGLDPDNLDDADEIWKIFVRYNVDGGGIKSSIVYKYWISLPESSMLFNRKELISEVSKLKDLRCYKNFTTECPVTFKAGSFIDSEKCLGNGDCPFMTLTKELKWHKAHYRMAKILLETSKRLLIENEDGSKNGNLNDVVSGFFLKYKDCDHKSELTTAELLTLFEDIKGYGNPPKVITWMLSEMSSPVHNLNHWEMLDYHQLNPVDTHVNRLMERFGFLEKNEINSANINLKLNELYPDEPRKFDFALYRLGAEMEQNICGKEPKCDLCKEKFPKIFNNCPFLKTLK
ncbi:MAG: hypothetical protein CVV28_10030 [Methanobacteriales archaeon HGW-Methanobacteriales-1]|nr:MAG: hypothetical protein CVV28_10030 [Methanobacteriales archaeon HGW-Methanobacteriales-1]